MNAAQKVIAKFGGQSALANLIGKRQSTVQHWAKTGVIPAKWQSELLKRAADSGVSLTPADFIATDEPAAASDRIPVAQWWGELAMPGGATIPCYVLDDGRRVISRNGATGVLTEGKGGGNLESYLRVEALKDHMPADLPGHMVEFSLENVVNKAVRGIEAETFIEICRAYVNAHSAGALQTDRQVAIAMKAAMFLAACSKVGLIALIDEATGYQYDRAQDALQFKYKIYLEDEMRKWEKTFPDELWIEFGRLTRWTGGIHSRPKYWGKLVTELVYEYLDPDVAKWLKEHVPEPRHGRNYHQWLSAQYGLKKLVEHLWMLVGMARACDGMRELREKMAEQYGRQAVQLTLFAPPPSRITHRRQQPPVIDQNDVTDGPGEFVDLQP